jgi:hypothetical protein
MKSLQNICSVLLISLLSIHHPTYGANKINTSGELIKKFLTEKKSTWKLNNVDIKNFVVSSEYTDKISGYTYVYMQQQVKGINIFNAVSSVSINNGKVFSFAQRIYPHAANNINTSVPSLDVPSAIKKASDHLKLTLAEEPKLLSVDKEFNKFIYSPAGISSEKITVDLVFQPVKNNLRLAWNVNIKIPNGNDWWNIRIDASNGEVLSKNNWTAHCEPSDPTNSVSVTTSSSIPQNNAAQPNTNPINNYYLAAPPASYRVFPLPFESPNSGPHTLITDPSDAVASPYGWHDIDGVNGADFTITRGNNAYSYEDSDGDDFPGYSSDGGSGLVFDFPFNISDYSQFANGDASIVNLFYTNNAVHDILYKYGFTEAAGNFQQNNYGNGGLANDYVLAEAFDGSFNGFATFATPRMQMYWWQVNLNYRESSVDNGIIIHEYCHGVSNRLTGGPSNTNCLSNAEQAGEGWSDWLALMLTAKNTDNGATPRGIGTYMLQQPTTGSGLRTYPYSTDMSINPHTYADLAINSNAQYIGEVWCSAIWDMSWLLIDQYGFSNNPSDVNAGNNIAIKLVMEGMKLQPCNPGFIDSRDAILLADQQLYNNAHRCLIWQAFAKRGMGLYALQRDPNVAGDEKADYTVPPPPAPPVINGPSGICKGQCATYSVNPVIGATAYIWTLPAGATITTTGPSVNVCYASKFKGGFLAVQIVSTCGTSPASAIFVDLIKSKPPKPINISGNTTVCAPGSEVYCISPVPTADSYNWIIDGSGNPSLSFASVQNTTCVTVTIPAGYRGNQKLKVAASNCKGMGDYKDVDIRIYNTPNQPGQINGLASVCRSQLKIYSIGSVGGATSYTWTASGGAYIAGGQGTTSIIIDFSPTTSANVVISVVANYACGSSVPRTRNVTVNLNCRLAEENSIPGGIDNSSGIINAYPNPSSGKITVLFDSVKKQNYALKVWNLLGKVVLTSVVNATEGINTKEIDLSGLTTGTYFVSLETENNDARVMRIVVE